MNLNWIINRISQRDLSRPSKPLYEEPHQKRRNYPSSPPQNLPPILYLKYGKSQPNCGKEYIIQDTIFSYMGNRVYKGNNGGSIESDKNGIWTLSYGDKTVTADGNYFSPAEVACWVTDEAVPNCKCLEINITTSVTSATINPIATFWCSQNKDTPCKINLQSMCDKWDPDGSCYWGSQHPASSTPSDANICSGAEFICN